MIIALVIMLILLLVYAIRVKNFKPFFILTGIIVLPIAFFSLRIMLQPSTDLTQESIQQLSLGETISDKKIIRNQDPQIDWVSLKELPDISLLRNNQNQIKSISIHQNTEFEIPTSTSKGVKINDSFEYVTKVYGEDYLNKLLCEQYEKEISYRDKEHNIFLSFSFNKEDNIYKLKAITLEQY